MTQRSDDGLRGLITKNIAGPHWLSIETGMTNPGVPDLNGCHHGTEVWIECKATSAWAIHIGGEQYPTISRRVRAGGRMWVAVRRRHKGGPKLGNPVDELWLIPGAHIVTLGTHGLRETRRRMPENLFILGEGQTPWDWRYVAQILFPGKIFLP